MAYQKQTFIDNVTVLNASMLNHIEEGIYNVEQNTLNKAELNSEGVIKSEHLPSSLLTQENLPATINAALAQAKASGEFKGDPGESGVYIGSGEMPEDCNVQIDPSGSIIDLTTLKNEIAQIVVESFDKDLMIGYVDNNNNITIKGNFTNGSYFVKYEMEDGSTIGIGNLTIDANTFYSITNNLTNCISSNNITEIAGGSSYSATISANSGYELKSVVVRMGGTNISASVVSGGSIKITNVTGDIVITAVAEEKQASGGNLADPNSSDWLEDHRLSTSQGTASEFAGHTVTNFIPAKKGDVLRVKGLDITAMAGNKGGVVAIYKSDKTYQPQFVYTGVSGDVSVDGGKGQVSVDGDVYTYTILMDDKGVQRAEDNTTFIRIDGVLLSGYTKNDVVITINEPINIPGTDTPEVSYTNWLPISTDKNGDPYVGDNGEKGYKANTRISVSSGNEKDEKDYFCTGFIPVKFDEIIRIKNINMGDVADYNTIVFYDALKTKIVGVGLAHPEIKIENNIYIIDPKLISSTLKDTCEFIRFGCGEISDDTIVTINQEIV